MTPRAAIRKSRTCIICSVGLVRSSGVMRSDRPFSGSGSAQARRRWLANNLGLLLLDQERHGEALEAFKAARGRAANVHRRPVEPLADALPRGIV